ncbi:Fibronectin type 3 and ankyrin repeat domains 1 protein [Fukomys damarensis]|uniref:Fibronectin type 3 and ankyrin repeat domains 1 protein n=1 Tax=Fukomys damarensis TaxID=885580 RepID=A0A091CQU8_FUKDA|nr:Fibronectin type 3 and ankyrin repeat domains 1 protein [Fukomys damarensis]
MNLKDGRVKDSLMLACYEGHLDVVKYLRRHGASWDARDLGGCTALHWATDGGHCPVIDWMIKDGCEVDRVTRAQGGPHSWESLRCQQARRWPRCSSRPGANVNVKDKGKKTPFMVAVLNNHEQLVELLLDKEADASIKK